MLSVYTIKYCVQCTLQTLQLFPKLQPLVATMGWDLLTGNVAARRNLMQLLWKSKSQVIQLEESSLYGYNSDEVLFIFIFQVCFEVLDIFSGKVIYEYDFIL